VYLRAGGPFFQATPHFTRPSHDGGPALASVLALRLAVPDIPAPYTRGRVAMAPPRAMSAYPIACPFCCMSFRKTPNLARHVQTSHKNESRCAAAAAAAAATSQSFERGSMAAMASAPGPALLDADVAGTDDAVVPSSVVRRAAATDAGAPQSSVVGAVSVTASDAVPNANAVNVAANVGSTQVPPVVDDGAGTEDVDMTATVHHATAGICVGADNGGAPPNQLTTGVTASLGQPVGGVPASGAAGVATPPHEADDLGGVLVGQFLYDTDDEGEGVGAAEDGNTIGASAVDLLAALPQHVFLSSTAARIRAYYLAFPETSHSSPVVPLAWASRPSRFCSPALRGALRFALTAGGCGLTESDHVAYAQSLCAAEQEATQGTSLVGPVSAAFPSAHGFLTATRHEQNRVLATRGWMEVTIEIGGRSFLYYYRDILKVSLDALAGAENVSFGRVPSAGNGVAADDEAGDEFNDDHERHGTLDADLYVNESRDVRRVHGSDARVLGVQLHADEALVSWSGAHYMFPVRVRVTNVLDNGGQWQTVGYIQHISKAVGRTAGAMLAVSDMRNDLFQRCLAVSLRAFTCASEESVSSHVAGHGSVLLVPRVVGIVVDQVEERSILALMGNRCRFFCSPCMESKDVSGGLLGVRAVDRDVVTTLGAQLAAALVRAEDPRASRRRSLGREHSALAFAPALGAVHGLGTAPYNLYRVVSFDLLHVWKLGILRLLAQRLPAVMRAVCAGDGRARLGSVQDTLDALNLRGFELGRNCKVTPSAPGYVVTLLLWRTIGAGGH